MEIKRYPVRRMELSDFADEHELVLEIFERSPDASAPRYYAGFARAEIMQGHGLLSVTGNGETEDEAILDYTARISGQKLALNAWTDHRKEIQVPILTYKQVEQVGREAKE